MSSPAHPAELAAQVQKMTFKRIERAETTPDDSMEVDGPRPCPGPHQSSVVTPRPPAREEDDLQVITHREDTSEIQILSMEEKINLLVKEHRSIKKLFDQAPDLSTKRSLIHRAQESQKGLQKLIPNKEIEDYVQGWNPWEAKRSLFPPAKKNPSGKTRSSTSEKMRYNDPDRWAEVAEIALAVKGLYDHTRRHH